MSLTEVYEHLLASQGPQHWWPGETPLEISVGAILTQNTSWANVEKAIGRLKEAQVLSVKSLHALPPRDLAELIRPAGYFNIKTKRLKNFIRYLVEQCEGDLAVFLAQSTETVRARLLSISGIGPETADSIALYAGGHPLFVVDAYTKRIFVRHAWVDSDVDYFALQEYCESSMPREVTLYNDFHAQLVMVGKNWCKRREPNCEHCPLKDFLPHGGPITV